MEPGGDSIKNSLPEHVEWTFRPFRVDVRGDGCVGDPIGARDGVSIELAHVCVVCSKCAVHDVPARACVCDICWGDNSWSGSRGEFVECIRVPCHFVCGCLEEVMLPHAQYP